MYNSLRLIHFVFVFLFVTSEKILESLKPCFSPHQQVIHRPSSQVCRFRDSRGQKLFKPLSPLQNNVDNIKDLQRYQPLPSINHSPQNVDDQMK